MHICIRRIVIAINIAIYYFMKIYQMYYLRIFLVLYFVPSFCDAQSLPIGHTFTGKSSFYANKFNGRKTSSGEKLNNNDFTCAHPSLPFGTMLEIENPVNKKWCIVRVNDRGPFTKARIIDVSLAAAKKIKMIQQGVITINVMIVGYNSEIIIRREPGPEIDIDEVLPENMQETLQVPYKKNKSQL